MTRSIAFLLPLSTTWPGALSLAVAQTSPVSFAAAAAISCAAGRSTPSSAAIAPSPTGTAFCIAWPRRLSSRAASASPSAPAAASAEYSPREWPATKASLSPTLNPPSRSSTRMTARLTAISAGWVFSVSVRSRSNPSNISRDSFCDSASSISWNVSRAAGNASASARAHADGLRALARKDEGAGHVLKIPLGNANQTARTDSPQPGDVKERASRRAPRRGGFQTRP